MSIKIIKPWDDTNVDETSGNNDKRDYPSQNNSLESETIWNEKRTIYGIGKPVRISIIGDIKHDTNN